MSFNCGKAIYFVQGTMKGKRTNPFYELNYKTYSYFRTKIFLVDVSVTC